MESGGHNPGMPQPDSTNAADKLSKMFGGRLDQDDAKTRSFWMDNVLEFLEIDTIPKRLFDAVLQFLSNGRIRSDEVLAISESWLRATAQRGDLGEEGRHLTHFGEAHRWYTAWVAAENGHERMVLDLIQGRDPEETMRWIDWNPAISTWVYFIWQFLMQRGSFATKQVDISLWKPFVAGGRILENGWTFLHCAAAWGDVTCMEELLKDEYAQDVDRRTGPEELYTALHLAAYYDNVGTVISLLKHGANVNVIDGTGRTPLHHASEQGCLASVEALLKHAAEFKESILKLVEMVDENGMSALHLASCRGHTEVVRALLSQLPFAATSNLCRIKSHAKDLTHEKAFIARSLRQWRDSDEWSGFGWWRRNEYTRFETGFNRDASRFLKPNRLHSQVWSPGGFSALHFAVVYGNNTETIHEILQHVEEKEALVTIKDSLGLTPADWAQVVDLRKAQEIIINKRKDHGGDVDEQEQYYTSRKVSCIKAEKARRHYEEVKAAEQERMRLQWTIQISEALLCKEWDDVRRLTSEGVLKQMKIKVDDCVWEHLEWVISKTLEFLPTKEYRVSMIERMVVQLVKGKAFFNNDSAMERCLMWAVEQEMVHLVQAIVRDNGNNCKCDLLSVARGKKSSPLQAATDKAGEHGSQLVAVMEQQEDVQRRLYEDRQVYVDYANTILVGAVLIAALAYQGWVQKPQGYAGMPLNSDTKGMLFFAWCNSLGFFLSMGAVLAAAVAAMPLRRGRLVKFREKSEQAGMVASALMAASVACEVIGFAVAAVSVESHGKSMACLASISTIIVFILAAWFCSRVNELHPFLDFLRAFRFLLNYICHPFYSRPFQLYVSNPFYLYVFHPLKCSFFGSIISSCLSPAFKTFNKYFIHLYRGLQDCQYRLKRWAERVAGRVEKLGAEQDAKEKSSISERNT